jgi:uncharacterized membrane protein YhhN
MSVAVDILRAWWPVVVMAVDWAAVAKGWRRLEYVAKPAAMVALLAWLLIWMPLTGARCCWPWPLAWFALGIICSLAGDVLLMLPERFFLVGLVAFLLAHVAYIVGFNIDGLLLPVEALLVVPVGMAGAWLFWRVSAALAAKGRSKLRGPVAVYAAVISLMVVSAVTTLFRPYWIGTPAALASIGAVLFFVSDALLAWNRFISPVRHGKLLIIVAYHLGQMAIMAGAVNLIFQRIPI